MNESLRQVAEFHQTFNHPIAAKPTFPSKETVDFRKKFITEELEELEKAVEEGNMVEVADAIADIQYVLNGLILNCGLQNHMAALMSEVHRSNMSKSCASIEEAEATMEALKAEGVESHFEKVGAVYVVYRTKDNKVMKNVNYSKANLASVLENPLLV